ncbi:hypothetical protein SLS56_004454 [Neofusicoccum ribis]|uniref:Ankyrin repeat protein n=1 Tax=Neofusicoccum ribis TaxID=45134 RepID=A0ABR3SY30_9PEZI
MAADPLSISASIAGLVTLADVVFIRTFKYVQSVKGAEKEISSLANELQSLSGVLHSLHLRIGQLDNYTNTHNASFRPQLIDSCLRLLIKVRDKLEKHNPGAQGQEMTDSSMRRLKWPFSVANTKELITDIERHKGTLAMALSADTMTAAQTLLSKQEQLQSDMDEIKTGLKRRRTFEDKVTDFMAAAFDEREREVIQFFGSVNPRERDQTNFSLRHPRTGLWLLESDEFQGWLDEEGSKLWLSGIPGAGKTVIASAVIEKVIEECSLSNYEKGFAYFYCDYKDEKSQEPSKIMGSLAAQLAVQNEQSMKILRKHYERYHLPGKHHSSSGKPSLVTLIQEMSENHTDVAIIVDALDECGKNVATVAEMLASLNAEQGRNIKTLFLSRDEHEIRFSLQDTFVHVPIAARSSDLSLYVASEIETRMSSGKLRIRNPTLKSEIMERLVNESDGM